MPGETQNDKTSFSAQTTDDLVRSIPLAFPDLFVDPLREVTRQRQQQVLISGALSVVLATGITVKDASIGPVDLGPLTVQSVRLLVLAVTAYLTTVYALTWYEDWVVFENSTVRRLNAALADLHQRRSREFTDAIRRLGEVPNFEPEIRWIEKFNEIERPYLIDYQILVSRLKGLSEGSVEQTAIINQMHSLTAARDERIARLGPSPVTPTITSDQSPGRMTLAELEEIERRRRQHSADLTNFLTTFRGLRRRRAVLELVLPLIIGTLGLAMLGIRVAGFVRPT
jgi:hypothetical protein